MLGKFYSFFLFFSIVLLSTGCSDSATFDEPDNLIEEPQMVEVLSDICKVEARFQRRLTIRNLNNTELVLHNYNIVFDKHNITLNQFKESYDYYQLEPASMQVIFDSVIVTLTKEQALMQESKNDSSVVSIKH